jgi:hypothetical protein
MNGNGGAPPARPRTPATRRVRTFVAVAFVAVWLLAILIDFFLLAEPVLPAWFHLMGMLVLGFVLGLSTDDLPRPGAPR